jgi:predicted TIM-barrel fold metal-dependent hydrolase
MSLPWVALVASPFVLPASAAAQAPAPIIDMHLHAFPLRDFGDAPPEICLDRAMTWPGVDPREPIRPRDLRACASKAAAPGSDAEVMRQTLAALRRHNVWAVTSGDLADIRRWRAADPDRIIPALNFFDGPGGARAEYVEELRRLYAAKEFAVFGEVSAQYRGLSPADPALEPFFALAEELDVPVGIHMGHGAVGGPYMAYPRYRAALGNPLLLEDVLIRHAKLRLYVMHAGFPMVDELILLLRSHPQVYVDIAGDNWQQTRQEFDQSLRRLVEAGYGKRIMFGSDQMVWPQTIAIAIDSIESAAYLSPEQKRDIMYNNAARFLRLDAGEIARHHRP